jgi:acetyl-CoA acetyltransferase family protein
VNEVYLVDGVRTPFGKATGSLASVRPDDLAALVLLGALERAGVPRESVDEVIFGCANQSGEDNRNVARMAILLSGLPLEMSGYTVNRLCASGLTAIASAAQQVAAGEADVVIAGGVESMSRAPWVMGRPTSPYSRPTELVDSSLGWRFINSKMREVDGGAATISLGETAERVAAIDGITRSESDEYAMRSHLLAAKAVEAGLLAADIISVESANGPVSVDEGPRSETTLEKLARLKPVFSENGIVTAASSSPLSDGAAAVVVASGQALRELGLKPRARIVGTASAGVQPSLMGLGPVPATQKLLDRHAMSISDLDAVEINEAFAPQVIACARRLNIDESVLNAWGGAIALGHPLGASGARLALTMARRLEDGDLNRGLVTLCVGVGQGTSMILERV